VQLATPLGFPLAPVIAVQDCVPLMVKVTGSPFTSWPL
jgi:hypothetical protein